MDSGRVELAFLFSRARFVNEPGRFGFGDVVVVIDTQAAQISELVGRCGRLAKDLSNHLECLSFGDISDWRFTDCGQLGVNDSELFFGRWVGMPKFGGVEFVAYGKDGIQDTFD